MNKKKVFYTSLTALALAGLAPGVLAEEQTQLSETSQVNKGEVKELTIQEQIEQTEQELTAAVELDEQLAQELKLAETELGEITGQISSIEKLQKEYADLESSIPAKQSQLTALKEEQDSKEKAVAAKGYTVDDKQTLETKVAELTAEKTAAETRLTEVTGLLADYQSLQSKIPAGQTVEDFLANSDQKIADLSKQLQDEEAKTAGLQQSLADAEKAAQPVTTETEIATSGSYAQRAAAWKNSQYAHSYLEDVRFSGQRTETIEYDANYAPDYNKVSEHFVTYVNELRQLNGLGNLPTQVGERAKQIAQQRAAEVASLNQGKTYPNFDLTHSLLTNQGLENLFVLDGFTYADLKSDKELAYYLVLQWFSEYLNILDKQTTPSTNPSKNLYNHRENLLAGYSEGQGLGVASFPGYFSTGGATEFAAIAMAGQGLSSSSSHAAEFSTSSDWTHYTNGQPTVFLPEITFRYVTTTVTPGDTTTVQEANQALQTNLENIKRLTKDVADETTLNTGLKDEIDKLQTANPGQAASGTTIQDIITGLEEEKNRLTETELPRLSRELTDTESDLALVNELVELIGQVNQLGGEIQRDEDRQLELAGLLPDLEQNLPLLNGLQTDLNNHIQTLRERQQQTKERIQELEDELKRLRGLLTPSIIWPGSVLPAGSVVTPNIQTPATSSQGTAGAGAGAGTVVAGTPNHTATLLSTGSNQSATTYSRVARAKENHLPDTGEGSSLLTLVGLGMIGFGILGRKRRQD